MTDYDGIIETVVTGLSEYLGCKVIESNSNGPKPAYDYLTYKIITPMSENKGTYGEYEDGIDRKPFTQTWSLSALSNKAINSVKLANKARTWLDRVGTTYLNDKNIIVQSCGSVANRDNLLSIGYEYKNGFDFVLWLFDEIENPAEKDGYIEAADFGGINVEMPPSLEELNKRLKNRLDGEVVE